MSLSRVIRDEPLLTLLLAAALPLTLLQPPSLRELPEALGLRAVLLVYALSIVSVLMTDSRIFRWLASRIASRLSPANALAVYVLVVGLASSIILNDVACVVFAGFSLLLAQQLGLPPSLAAVATAMAANIGSSLTPIGNPQNILVWHYYRVGFAEFTLAMSLFALPSLAALALYTRLLASRSAAGERRAAPVVRVEPRSGVAALALLALDVVSSRAGLLPEALATLATLASGVALSGRPGLGEPGVALTLALLVYDFNRVATLLEAHHLLPTRLPCLHAYLYALLLSQLVSNVPATVMLLGRTSCWRAIALGADLAGVGLIHASLANLIVARLTGVSAREYHRIALPYFAALAAIYTSLALLAPGTLL